MPHEHGHEHGPDYDHEHGHEHQKVGVYEAPGQTHSHDEVTGEPVYHEGPIHEPVAGPATGLWTSIGVLLILGLLVYLLVQFLF
jgi:hypothetical protein